MIMKDSRTYLKNITIPPKKLRFYLKSVKNMSPVSAMEHLLYGHQRATDILYQAVKSAINNAKNTLKVTEDLLKFKAFTIEEGLKLKRYRPGSRGTPKPIMRRKSHIKIILTKTIEDKIEKSVKEPDKTTKSKPELKIKKNIK